MTKQEVAILVKMATAYYPNFLNNYSDGELNMVVNLWETVLGHRDAELMTMAFYEYIAHDHAFACNAGQLVVIAEQITEAIEDNIGIGYSFKNSRVKDYVLRKRNEAGATGILYHVPVYRIGDGNE